MNRRGFLASLLALPFVRAAATAETAPRTGQVYDWSECRTDPFRYVPPPCRYPFTGPISATDPKTFAACTAFGDEFFRLHPRHYPSRLWRRNADNTAWEPVA